ncbi:MULTISPECIES: LPS export ABC transporter permease LptF [Pseudomonadaceae]|uniref:Lipopolysaccharide export system permease protein LptF n=1 Tax=Stutzerimonas kunmingensis TaxID=1211807 RepID=A0A9X1N8A0_9GAMM|nr:MULTISPECIES: LPS export ABC transporter permease LptF [Pseudomonadaceae]MBB60423.1 LPS export ABC transporter permease LptF [Pseudomonas sp.]MBP2697835.1 LPS export ABC transporter permease LptF [Pseudomonas aeruginosa]MCD1610544.1 LPS export ABC transporter permease LptF [Stutzerimonas kunmingensis]QTB75908.1 LPS export ABC transporter permease LptF [Pseudomonas aeruginosa]QTB88048.1 LPS export ABC transporter permease LptF [Pseudomonas aeruginosa]
MLLIERYVIAETRRPLVIMLGILIFVFATYSAQRYLAQAANGSLALNVVFNIVYYKVLIALEVLIPVAVYVSVVLGLGRLYHDAEMTALSASGMSPLRIYLAVALLALPVSLLVAAISLDARPWAYANAFDLEQQSKTDLDVNHLLPERFNINRENGRMIWARTIDHGTGKLHDAFIYDTSQRRTHVFRADQAWIADPNPDDPVIKLAKGNGYALEHLGARDESVAFNAMTMHLAPIESSSETRRKAAPTARLRQSTALPDRAELQWRETRGLSTLLLALLAVPLSRTAPRRGRFASLLPVTAVYALVFFGGDICKSLVSHGSLPALPGLWLVPSIMAISLIILLLRDIVSIRLR